MEAEKEQHLFGELVNMILTKKQKLEAKYPNKVFKTVGSVMNFEDNDDSPNPIVETTSPQFRLGTLPIEDVLNTEVNTTDGYGWKPKPVVDDVLDSEVETTAAGNWGAFFKVDEVLNNEVETTQGAMEVCRLMVDEVLNFEVETTHPIHKQGRRRVDEVLNCEVETTQSALAHYDAMVDEVLNCEVETTGFVSSPRDISMGEVLDSDVKIRSGELIEENEMMDKVLEIQNIQPTERGANDMVDFVLDVEDYQAWDGKQKTKVNEALENTIEIEKIGYSKTHRLRPVTGALDYNDNPIEIKSIRKLKGESPLQDIIVSQILDESDKVTDKLKMKEDDYVKTYSHDVYMCDHLVQNVLDIGVNSIHYDTHNHQPIVDGILKKA